MTILEELFLVGIFFLWNLDVGLGFWFVVG